MIELTEEDKQRILNIHIQYGKNNLEKCTECGQLTMEIEHSYEYYDQSVTWYRCYFCGYTNNSTWTNPRHGKYYEDV